MHGSPAGTTGSGQGHLRVGVAIFRRAYDEDQRPGVFVVQADPVVEIHDLILEQGDPQFVSVGDGIVTFRCINGDITYGLRDHDDLKETWIGVRSGVELDDEEPPVREGGS